MSVKSNQIEKLKNQIAHFGNKYSPEEQKRLIEECEVDLDPESREKIKNIIDKMKKIELKK